MGLLSWWRGDNKKNNQSQSQSQPQLQQPSSASPKAAAEEEVPGMNGAVEVPRQPLAPELMNVAVFEFGSVAATADKVTLTGYCPVSDELEPCRWEILPAASSNAPQFRVAF